MLEKCVDLYTPPPLRQKHSILRDFLIYRHIPGSPSAVISKRDDELFVGKRRIGLYLAQAQRKGECSRGEEVYKELLTMGDVFPNINLRDFLAKNPDFIPQWWRKKDPGNYVGCGRDRQILFCGTIFALAPWPTTEELAPHHVCSLEFQADGSVRTGLQIFDTSWCKTEAIAVYLD